MSWIFYDSSIDVLKGGGMTKLSIYSFTYGVSRW